MTNGNLKLPRCNLIKLSTIREIGKDVSNMIQTNVVTDFLAKVGVCVTNCSLIENGMKKLSCPA